MPKRQGEEGEEQCLPPGEADEALQLDHRLDEGKFHVGVSWVHLDGLKGKREQYNGMSLGFRGSVRAFGPCGMR